MIHGEQVLAVCELGRMIRGRLILAAWRWLDRRVCLPEPGPCPPPHGHTCIVCPREVRSLHAAAQNLVFDAQAPGGIEAGRLWRRLTVLADEVAVLNPVIDYHIKAAVDNLIEEGAR